MPARQKNRYDSFLIWLYCNDKANLVPEHIRHCIPHSTASTWRTIDYEKLIGHELRNMQQEAIYHYALMQEHLYLKRVVKVVTKAWLSISVVVLPILYKQKGFEATVLNEIQ